MPGSFQPTRETAKDKENRKPEKIRRERPGSKYGQVPGDASADSTSSAYAGDQYTGLDRFGRVVDQRWIKTGPAPYVTRNFEIGFTSVI